jgi:hypothetical protein
MPLQPCGLTRMDLARTRESGQKNSRLIQGNAATFKT